MKYCLILFCGLFASCAVNKAKHWDKATFDNKYNLDFNGIIRRRVNIPEPAEGSDYVLFQDTSYHQSKIKTSDVSYFEIKQKNQEHWVVNQSKNNCRAYLPKSDSLVIRIGNDFIFHGSGMGFEIHYYSGNFYTVPYVYYHIYTPNEPKPKYKIREQELVLDKEKYNVGDSLYGKIYFHISETLDYRKFNKGGITKTEHYASGSFRAIVKKDFYW